MKWYKRHLKDITKLLAEKDALFVGVFHTIEMLAAECNQGGRVRYGGQPPSHEFVSEKCGLDSKTYLEVFKRISRAKLVSDDYRVVDWASKQSDYENRKKQGDYPKINTSALSVLSDNYPITIEKLSSLDIDIDIDKDVDIDILNSFLYYKRKIQPKARYLPKHVTKIRARLKTFSYEDLTKAVDKFSADEWWVDNCAKYGCSWFFSSDDRIEKSMNITPRKKPVTRDRVDTDGEVI